MDNKEIVRTHYNRHATSKPSFDRAIATRQQGKAAALKDFHNHIKRMMIKRYAQDADKLLDLCCGRGGDIIKWFNFGVKKAKGVDISEGEVVEAAQRFAEQKAKPGFRGKPLEAEFEVCDMLGEKEWADGTAYDVVTCMFAMHYFFEQEHSLKMFLRNVALNLKPGGIFMGTIPCGKRVLQLLRSKDVFESKMLKLEKKWEGEAQIFGQAYTCAITDTVTEGRGDSVGSLEYLTFMKPVERILASHGIFPVTDYRDRVLEECFDPADRDATLKHFDPHFPRSEGSLEAASALFGAFVFRKSRSLPPVRQPAAGLIEQPPVRVPRGLLGKHDREGGDSQPDSVAELKRLNQGDTVGGAKQLTDGGAAHNHGRQGEAGDGGSQPLGDGAKRKREREGEAEDGGSQPLGDGARRKRDREGEAEDGGSQPLGDGARRKREREGEAEDGGRQPLGDEPVPKHVRQPVDDRARHKRDREGEAEAGGSQALDGEPVPKCGRQGDGGDSDNQATDDGASQRGSLAHEG